MPWFITYAHRIPLREGHLKTIVHCITFKPKKGLRLIERKREDVLLIVNIADVQGVTRMVLAKAWRSTKKCGSALVSPALHLTIKELSLICISAKSRNRLKANSFLPGSLLHLDEVPSRLLV